MPCRLQITINVPLTDKTKGIFNKEAFAKMKVTSLSTQHRQHVMQ